MDIEKRSQTVKAVVQEFSERRSGSASEFEARSS